MKDKKTRRAYADNSSEKTEAIFKTAGPSATVIKAKDGKDLRGGNAGVSKRGAK